MGTDARETQASVPTSETPTNAVLSSSMHALTAGRSTRLSSRAGDNSDSLRKRRAPDGPDASPSWLASAGGSEIRPFSSIAHTGGSVAGNETQGNHQEMDRRVATMGGLTRIQHSNGGLSAYAHSSSDILNVVKSLEHRFRQETKFLVLASTQSSMAPVWVPFQAYQSASSFLTHMADECAFHEWDPSAQLHNEISKWDGIPSAPQTVVAASVKFGWSGLHIRVRQDRDEDWELVMQELLDAWKLKMENGSEGVAQRFHIHVMLHVF